MLCPEIKNSVKNNVKLFRVSEFLPTADWHFFGLRRKWVRETLFK